MPAKRVERITFTLKHFKNWVRKLQLDSGGKWELEPFQECFVSDWLDGTPECWLLVPEGNGKTTLVAGLALYHAQFTPDAWVTVAASSRDQARILYRQAKGFVERSSSLQLAGFKSFDGHRRVDLRRTGSQIEIFASDERTGDGVIPTLCILDELHRHRDLGLYQTWRGKLGKRDGQLVAISTAGEPGSEFEQTRERIRQLAEVVERDETFVRAKHSRLVLHEWAVPEDGNVRDFELVARANPFSGVTPEFLAEKFSTPTLTLAHWKRFTCNIATRSELAAITEQEWLSSRTDEEIPEGERIWVGLDVGWKGDTTALVPLWIRDPDFRLFGPATILVPPRDGNHLPPDAIKRAFDEINRRNPVHTVVMDMSRAEDIAAFLIENGIIVIEHSTHNKPMALAYERFMEALRNRRLHHTGDPGLSRHALSAVTKITRFGETTFDIANRNYRLGHEIDALIAAAIVHSVAVSESESVYEERGLVTA